MLFPCSQEKQWEKTNSVKNDSKDYLNISCCNWLKVLLHKFGKAYPNQSGKHDWVRCTFSLVVWSIYGKLSGTPLSHVHFITLQANAQFHPSHTVLRQPCMEQKACHGVSEQSWDMACAWHKKGGAFSVNWNHFSGYQMTKSNKASVDLATATTPVQLWGHKTNLNWTDTGLQNGKPGI